MAKKPWIHFAGTLYNVISRGNRRQVIFRDEGGYERYRKFLMERGAGFQRERSLSIRYMEMNVLFLGKVRKCIKT